MEAPAIASNIREVIAGVFSLAVDEVGVDSSIDTIEAWDSMGHVNLMMALEEQFGIKLDVDDAIEMTSMPDICKILEKYLGESQ